MIVLCIDSTKLFLPSTLVEWIQLFSTLLSGFGIFLAGKAYKDNKKLRRAEWLKSLFEKFYENDHYKNARRWLDFDEIKPELNDDKDHTKEEQVSDFLNFFEFIAALEKEEQITLTEIEHLFAYYLRKIKASVFCKNYIENYKFENLKALLHKDIKK